jgi:hypothetical protein
MPNGLSSTVLLIRPYIRTKILFLHLSIAYLRLYIFFKTDTRMRRLLYWHIGSIRSCLDCYGWLVSPVTDYCYNCEYLAKEKVEQFSPSDRSFAIESGYHFRRSAT